MNRNFLTLIALLCMIHIGCDDTPNPQDGPSFQDLDVVTGIRLTDSNGNPMGTWNFPNDKPGSGQVFPNPAIDIISLFDSKGLELVWITPAECLIDSLTENIPGKSAELQFEATEIADASILDYTFSNGEAQISLNLETLQPGYYRLCYQLVGGTIFWTNIFIDPTSNTIPTVQALDVFCEQP